MKTLHDGTEVVDDAICGSNAGKYPRLDKGGKRLDGHGVYLLQGDELATYTAEQDKYMAEAPKRERERIMVARNKERGSWQEQMEYLIDNGYDALKQRDDAIKSKHPK